MPLPTCQCNAGLPIQNQLANIYCALFTLAEGAGPDGGFVTLNGEQTVTNKTLIAPIIDEILDTNGNIIVQLTPVANAVNHVDLINRGAGISGPIIGAAGDDADINLNLQGKGSGSVVSGAPFVAADSFFLQSDLLDDAGSPGASGDVLLSNGGGGSGTAWSSVFEVGTYTPTLTNGANVAASTASVAQYLRVGNMITVSGQVSIDPTAPATSTVLGISFPIASNIVSANQCGGVAFATGIAGQGAGIIGNAASNRADMVFISADVTNQVMAFTFTYQGL